MINKRIPLILTVVTAIVAIVILSIELFGNNSIQNSIINLKIILMVLAMSSAVTVFIVVRTITDTPSTLSISIIGYPESGKTVYINVLFDLLQKQYIQKFKFFPFGPDTIERVVSGIDKLRKGQWLPKTKMGDTDYYRAYINLPTTTFTLRPNKYRLEIGDFAGEHIIDDPSGEEIKWLHKNQYFKYVLQSNIIFLAIDSEKVINGEFSNMISGFIGAIHVLGENMDKFDNKKFSIPLGILFMKSDLLDKSILTHTEVERSFFDLKKICEIRFKYVKTFFVSSVGEVTEEGNPPRELNPIGVTEPLKWAIERLS